MKTLSKAFLLTKEPTTAEILADKVYKEFIGHRRFNVMAEGEGGAGGGEGGAGGAGGAGGGEGGAGEGKGGDGKGGDGKGDDGAKFVPVTELEKANARAAKAEKIARENAEKLAALGGDAEKLKSTLAMFGDDPAKFMENFKKMQADAEAAKLKDATELEKTLHENKKLQGRIDELLGTSTKEKNELLTKWEQEKKDMDAKLKSMRAAQLDGELIAAAAANNAANPEQIMRMLKGDITFDETNGSFVYEYKGRGDAVHTKPLADYVKEFLSDEKNRNLVRAGGQPRAGAQPGQPGHTGNDKDQNGKPGDAYTVDKDGYMTLGRVLTAHEKRDAEASGLSEREWEDRRARMLKGQSENEKAAAELAKGGQRPLLPGEVRLS